MPTIRLQYFAMLKESRGKSEETLLIPDGLSAAELYAELFPDLHAAGLPVAYAINQKYTQPSSILNEGDELVFLPPVGGG